LGAALKTVAVLTANPALSAILSVVLAANPLLRVRPFESELALTTYMRITPIDVLVCDLDSGEARADRLAHELRHDEQINHRDFQIIALARSIDEKTRLNAIRVGIDEVIVKPMSPRYLLERVLSRLRARIAYRHVDSSYHGPERRGRIAFPPPSLHSYSRAGDNVVSIFSRQPIN
jgi:two-component system, OmpR family, phosphate regulon response regulator PhoB